MRTLYELSRFIGLKRSDAIPLNSSDFEDVANADLRDYLTRLDRNLSGRIYGEFAWASNMRSYCSLFAEPLNIKVGRVVALYEQIRKEEIVTPEQIKSPHGHDIQAFKREQLWAVGALVWADGQKSGKEPDIVAIAHKELGESSIKDFIHKGKPAETDSDGYQEKPARQQKENNVQEKPVETGTIRQSFEKIENLKDVAHYTREELIKRFGQTQNYLDNVCVLKDNHLPEGVNNSGKQVIIYSNLYCALMEIAYYHKDVSYDPRQVEIFADNLTGHGVRELLIMCLDDLRLGYENIGEILEAVRKAKGV